MRRYHRKSTPWTRAASATLVLVCLLPAAGAGLADEEPSPDRLPGGVVEPFFGFLLSVMDGDSLGVWTAPDLTRYAEAQGRPSRMPLESIAELRRRRPHPVEKRRWPRAELRAVWELTMVSKLQLPMPYSILGYHPGSLRIAQRLLLSELALGDRTFVTEEGEYPQGRTLTDIHAVRIDSGHVVLDADRLPDMLLGGNLDDAWTLGFVAAREEGRRIGLAVSVKRDGGPIFGQFDFERDRIMKSGSPLGSVLSRWCRGWFRDPDSSPPAFWTGAEK